jgi:hypothetical protein
VLAVYSVLTQMVGVFFYPNGHWDSLPNPVNGTNGRMWNWRDNPIGRSLQGGFYWQPYAIVGTALTDGLPAAARRMNELNVNPFGQIQPATIPQTGRGLP